MTELSLVAGVTYSLGKQHDDFWYNEYSKKTNRKVEIKKNET